jgi:putative toxin-antitoxin system antitoxin component (TIGR02293 family)
MMARYEISKELIIHQLGISESTFRRREFSGRLTPVESDRLYRMADAVVSAEEVLGNRDKAIAWLHTPNRALGGETPLSMLDTEVGYQRVRDILGRIEHGVYS